METVNMKNIEDETWWSESGDGEFTIVGNISDDSHQVVGFVDALRAQKGPISLMINSHGGELFAALAIHRAIREWQEHTRQPVRAHVPGVAVGAAAVILAAAAIRTMSEYAMLMIVRPYVLTVGDSGEHIKAAEQIENAQRAMVAVYRDDPRVHVDIETVLNTGEQQWFNSQQALEAGLIDDIEGL